MGTVDQLVAVAESQVGTTSGEKYWDWYWGGSWPYIDGYTTPYCACFVSWCLAQADVQCDCFPSAVAFDWRDQSNALVDKYGIRRGDPVAFDWDGDLGGDHVGICTGVYDWGITTVEGNTSGGVVAACQRLWSVVICGLRPRFSEDDDMTEEQMRELLEQYSDETAAKSAQKTSEYCYGEEDAAANLNNYNAIHWGYRRIENIERKLDELLRRLDA